MKTLIPILILCASAHADTTIPIYLTSPGDILDSTPQVNFSDLDGIPVDGDVSVDFIFSQGEFARVFSETGWNFECGVVLQTSGNGFVGFLNGTGYLIDKDGNPIPGYGVTGGASSYTGWMAIGLFPLAADASGSPDTDLTKPFDFYGVHFDIKMPADDPLMITDGQFFITSYSPWGIGPGIPDDIPEPNTMVIALCGLALLSWWWWWAWWLWRKK